VLTERKSRLMDAAEAIHQPSAVSDQPCTMGSVCL